MPAFVNKTHFNSLGSATAIDLDWSPALGNALIVGVYLSDNTYSVSSFLDSAGFDIFGNPINTWQNLGTVNLGSARLELWGCNDIIAAQSSTYQINITFNGAVPNSAVTLEEYSGLTAFVTYGTAQNSGYNDLFFNGTASSNNDVLLVAFLSLDQFVNSGNGVLGDQITPATVRDAFNLTGGGGLTFMEQDVIGTGQSAAIIAAQAWTADVSSGLAAIGVVVTGGLVLSTPPGYSDIDAAQNEAGDPCRALVLAQIAENAALGMVRPEVFIGTYQNGAQIPEMISPVDGYQYSYDEQLYIFTPNTTFAAGNFGANGEQSEGWPSAAGILFYCWWDVQQPTDPKPGLVTCIEYYHGDGNVQPTQTNDGLLTVMIVCQRAQTSLKMSQPASAYTIDPTLEGEGLPVTQSQMQALIATSKFAAVKAEVFYCGEFVNGGQVKNPVSPADGYQYTFEECSFISSWKWTTQPSAFQTPPAATANGGNADGGWSQLNELQASVSASGLVSCAVFFNNHGVIDPSQPLNGGVVYGRLRVFAFCQRKQGPNFLTPPPNAGSAISSTQTSMLKIDVPAPVTGTLKLGIGADAFGDSFTFSKVVIKRTLAGSLAVIDTTTFTFSSSDGATVTGGVLFSDPVTDWTFDPAHDYYVMVVGTAGHWGEFGNAGGVNKSTPIQYGFQAGDITGDTTIPSLIPVAGTLYGLFGVNLTIVDADAADGFADIPINVFNPGQPLPFGIMSQIAANVKEGSRAVEFFGPTNHVNGNTISTPVSPIDGYEYAYSELSYIWQWHDTGTAATRLFGFGASISSLGVVATNVWHVPSGGSPTDYGNGGSEAGDGSIDVIVIAARSSYAAGTRTPNPPVGQNPPTDVTSLNLPPGPLGFQVNGSS